MHLLDSSLLYLTQRLTCIVPGRQKHQVTQKPSHMGFLHLEVSSLGWLKLDHHLTDLPQKTLCFICEDFVWTLFVSEHCCLSWSQGGSSLIWRKYLPL